MHHKWICHRYLDLCIFVAVRAVHGALIIAVHVLAAASSAVDTVFIPGCQMIAGKHDHADHIIRTPS